MDYLTEKIFSIHIPSVFGFSYIDKIEDYSTTWREIDKYYSSFIYSIQDGISVKININWNDITRHLDEKLRGVDNITVESTVQLINNNGHGVNFDHYIELALCNIFLLSNLSCPGCFNLFNSKIEHESKLIGELNFSNTPFEAARFISEEFTGWPELSRIPLVKVNRWYKELDIGIKQLADSNMERGLFALLHFCAESSTLSPNTTIWLMHALESLYHSPKENIGRTLQNRILLVLGEPKDNQRKIAKMIRELYTVRSDYVHGSSNIHHPLYNDIFDNRLDKYSNLILQSYDFASAIIVGTLQKMIRNQWRDIKFEEVFTGVK